MNLGTLGFPPTVIPAAAKVKARGYATGTASPGISSPFNVTRPVAALGDVILAIFGYATNTTLTPPAGWNAAGSDPGGGVGAAGIYTFTHVVGANEGTADSWTSPSGSGVTINWCLASYRGLTTPSPVQAGAQFGHVSSSTAPSLTVTPAKPSSSLAVWAAFGLAATILPSPPGWALKVSQGTVMGLWEEPESGPSPITVSGQVLTSATSIADGLLCLNPGKVGAVYTAVPQGM